MKRKAASVSTISSRLSAGLAAATVALFQPPAGAEDIDLFINPPSAAGMPNVLILLDNTANWNTPFTNELAALASTVQELPVGPGGSAKFRVGLMLFTETGSPNSNTDGGYVRAAIRDFNQTNKDLFVELVESLDILADKSNGGKAGLTMQEAYYYFDGRPPRSGNNKVKTDYTGNTSGTAASNAIYALGDNALDRFAGTQYNSPDAAGNCGKNFIIYISNGAVQDNNSDTSTARAGLAAVGGNTTTIPISPSGSQTNVADEWARFMKQSTHGIVTYTVDVDKVTTGQGPGWSALLRSIAGISDGKYFDVSSGSGGSEIADALKTIFSEIQAVNSVFASVALPVSGNPSGTFLNQIYIGMFRPDSAPLPRWSGNLKQYKLGIGNGRVQTQDADSVSAVNSATGFITECARSFWTPATVDNYWVFKPQGACLTVAGSAGLELSGRQCRREGGAGVHAAFWDRRTQPVQDLCACCGCVLQRADQFQHQQRQYYGHRAGRRQHGGARSADQLDSGAGHRRRKYQRQHDSASSFDPRRRRAFAPGSHQHGHGRVTRGRGVLWRQRRRAARHQRQSHREHRQRRRGQRDVGFHGARVLSYDQAAAR